MAVEITPSADYHIGHRTYNQLAQRQTGDLPRSCMQVDPRQFVLPEILNARYLSTWCCLSVPSVSADGGRESLQVLINK